MCNDKFVLLCVTLEVKQNDWLADDDDDDVFQKCGGFTFSIYRQFFFYNQGFHIISYYIMVYYTILYTILYYTIKKHQIYFKNTTFHDSNFHTSITIRSGPFLNLTCG